MFPPLEISLARQPFNVPRILVIVAVYGLAFLLLHRLAAHWGSGTAFSLWYPAAGLRFALIWHLGSRIGIGLALTELFVQTATGIVAGPDAWLTALGVFGSAIGYVAGIAAIKARGSSKSDGRQSPIAAGIAMLVAPLCAVCMSLPWGLEQTSGGAVQWTGVGANIATFWIGDVLGVLLIAPPVLWLLDKKRLRSRLVTPKRLVESSAVMAGGSLITTAVALSGAGLRLEPLLLCCIWVGLRLGRSAAWFVNSAVALLVLLWDVLSGAPWEERANLHMLLVAMAIASYLVASYAEMEAELRRYLRKQQRLLYHADRLRTLRAMSLAVIHDLSQPLSTVSIEAGYLREHCAGDALDRDELRAAASLIERKTRSMADVLRRMRSFGTDAAEDLHALSAATLMEDVAALIHSEARSAKVTIELDTDTSVCFYGRRIEMQQALINLVRNAIAAAAGGTIRLRTHVDGVMLQLRVEDDATGPPRERGMGIGLILARTIAESHGGSLKHIPLAPAGSCYAIVLPLSGPAGQ